MRCLVEFVQTFTGNAVLLGLFLLAALLITSAHTLDILGGGLLALVLLGAGHMIKGIN